MKTGIYEQIINQLFEEKISSIDQNRFYVGERVIKKDEVAKLLSMYLTSIFEQVLSDVIDADDGEEEEQTEHSVKKGLDLANAIIRKLVNEFHLDSGNLVSAQAKILTAVIDKTQADYPDLAKRLKEMMPLKGLVNGFLFTGKGMKMYTELQKEIASADEIRLMVSFIKKRGLALILPQLKEFTHRGGQLKVITTTYMQATDYEAVTQLASLRNTEIKITYDTTSERLHAKAYIFLRNTGFNTAYIGSSNISEQALDTGAEWNVKVTQMEQPQMMKTIMGAFDASWWAEGYETFVDGEDNERLKTALNGKVDNEIDFTNLKGLIRPFDYQQEILERLHVEREVRGHWRNLVVAATGTGKTVMAASDYKAFAEKHERAHLLFVAHREEILRQSLLTFRQVLSDYNFGEKWYGGEEPANYEFVFASKDTLNNRLETLHLPADYYDYIVVDEVHHVAASSYRKILDYFAPKVLLGLTATPERMDGEDITQDFDGTISAEIRLDDALNKGLLAPFYYYGITDSVDYSEVAWDKGHYVASELSRIYSYNDARTAVILQALQRYLTNIRDVRALCFCVDQQHAKYMASKFTLCGLKADVLISENDQMRTALYNRLKRKDINYLFVVDMFNEGVDIPEIDTILFLRPTESLTVFIQQFGRGLRKAEGKTHVDILDFVGNSRVEFNYADRMRVMLGRTSMSVVEEMERDCPHLPLGCRIILEPKAKEYIMSNIRGAILRFTARKVMALVQNFERHHSAPLTLANFVRIYQLPLDKLYKGRTWNQLLFEAGLRENQSAYNDELSRAVFRKWLATDAYSYLSFVERLAGQSFNVKVNEMSAIDQKRLLMFYYDMFENAGRFGSLQQMVDELSNDTIFCAELKEVLPLLLQENKAYEKADNSLLPDFPLKLHGVYTKAQIQVAIGTSTLTRKSSAREGVERNKGLRVEAMFVDIIKNREEGSTTDYDDKALSPYLFQWDAQNRVKPESKEGQAYIKQAQTMLLFVREQKNFVEDKSRTLGYVYLGRVTLSSWEYKNLGTRMQMRIRWNMVEPIPGSVMHFARIKEIA
ncbi:MAG: type III restriction protein res subunit [bacterium P3]|nr:MAG: type III restriction protein res subunit [bacterium P3]KWW40064.1 MAG: type III restriction protein res subunit [bacterium F083]